MKISWRTFPKLFVVLPILHYALSMFTSSESEEHHRKKELEFIAEKDKKIQLVELSSLSQK
ncbi:uncharacterized protein LOC132785672 [Drosophila nasuta]|uniref:Uncharacterized protein LOC117574782 n=1 Tax=Drosophila albomicans TaxID=7291 RepID=A0A6P8XNK2_DROAB|nr:uncharacterized protein LOC117574782 [Drosophila albomicans]XP_060647852.1 uncharacterized protein LOC132785672 [Drosophila nasuta]